MNLVTMAENSTLDNGTINDLYLTNGISENSLRFLITFNLFCGLIMLVPLTILAVLYGICRDTISEYKEDCDICENPTPTGSGCEQSKTKKVRFCSVIERWTVWLLVDLFRTPNVEIEKKNNKVRIKLLENRSLVLGKYSKEPFSGAMLFIWISFIFVSYILKFLVDFFLKLTPTCIDKGDFGIPAACYATSISYLDNSLTFTSQTSYQINCTTWNDNLELLGEELGLLFCFSFYYNVLTSVTEIMGLFGLQTVVVQVTLILLEKCTHLVGKYTQRMTEQDKTKQYCIAVLIILITTVGFIFTGYLIPLMIEITDPTNKKRFHEVEYQQLLPTQTALVSIILALLLILFTAEDDETTEETRNMREHDQEPLEEHQGPLEEHQGPLEEHQGPLEEHQGPLEEHQGPLEEHQGPLVGDTPM